MGGALTVKMCPGPKTLSNYNENRPSQVICGPNCGLAKVKSSTKPRDRKARFL